MQIDHAMFIVIVGTKHLDFSLRKSSHFFWQINNQLNKKCVVRYSYTIRLLLICKTHTVFMMLCNWNLRLSISNQAILAFS